MRIDGIILAAGLSTRMGENKLRLPFRGKPMLQHTIDLVAGLPLSSVILVTQEHTIAGMRIPDSFHVVLNSHPAQGQSLSMRLGLAPACGEGFLFFQGDQPLLDLPTVNAILSQANHEAIIVPVHAGVPGNPVFFAARYKDELMAVKGDRGGRIVRDRHPEACRLVRISRPEPLWDVDTRDHYAMLVQDKLPDSPE